MTPQGLIKLTAVANNIEAWRDWREMAEIARQEGMDDLAEKHMPRSDAGWRRIDGCRKRLIAAMVKRGYSG